MYEPPRQEERPGCRDTLVLIRAMFAVLLPFMGVMLAIVIAIMGTVAAYAVHPALALLPLAAVVGGIFAFARWERSRFRPPDV